MAHSLSLFYRLRALDTRPTDKTTNGANAPSVRQNSPATPYPPVDVRPPPRLPLLKLAPSRVLEFFGNVALVLYPPHPSVTELTRRLSLYLSACRVQLPIQ